MPHHTLERPSTETERKTRQTEDMLKFTPTWQARTLAEPGHGTAQRAAPAQHVSVTSRVICAPSGMCAKAKEHWYVQCVMGFGTPRASQETTFFSRPTQTHNTKRSRCTAYRVHRNRKQPQTQTTPGHERNHVNEHASVSAVAAT